MRRLIVLPLATLAAMAIHGAAPGAAARDPFAFFQPTFTVTAAERRSLDSGAVVVRVLPARDGELAVFAACRLDAPADALASWTERITELKRSPYVRAIRRFSEPPVLEDLEGLILDPDDLEAVRRCRPGDCDVKLTAGEIQTLRATVSLAGEGWREAVQQEFRRLVLRRIEAYRTVGIAGLAPHADRHGATRPAATFATILEGSPYLRLHAPSVASRLERYPEGDDVLVAASFLYWSKEQYGAGKPVIAVTHVEVVRPEVSGSPEVLVLSKEVLATHYRNGSLGVSAVIGDHSGTRYLVYVNRSQVDVLGGLLGSLKRKLIEGRMKSESTALVETTRLRLESVD